MAHRINGPRISVHAKNLIAFSKQIHQIASLPAARVEDPHPRRDTSPQKLVEEVDIDVSELALKVWHGDIPIIRDGGLLPTPCASTRDGLTCRSPRYRRCRDDLVAAPARPQANGRAAGQGTVLPPGRTRCQPDGAGRG